MSSNLPYIIGVTGGIGSGKSVVSRLLRLMGVPVYDCDCEAKRLMHESAEIRAALIKAVGYEVYQPDGRLNCPHLASYMFGYAERVALVNSIVHPVVRADFKQWARLSGGAVVAVESAILFEAGMDSDVDSVWVVHASEDVRLQRTIRRDASDVVSVRNRMESQLSDEKYMKLANKVVFNDGNHSLIQQVSDLLALQTSL